MSAHADPAAVRISVGHRGPAATSQRRAQTARRPAVAPIHGSPPVQPGAGPVRRVDLLSAERGNGRITEAQFLVGRMIQAVFERGSGARLGTAGWDVARSAGGTAAHDLAIILRLEDAHRIRHFTDRLETEIGRAGVRFLRAILAESHSFKSYAAARGQGSELGIRSLAERFRWLLEVLTETHMTAIGPEMTNIRGGSCPSKVEINTKSNIKFRNCE